MNDTQAYALQNLVDGDGNSSLYQHEKDAIADALTELAALRERVRVQGEQIGALREALAIAKETIAEFHGTSGWDFYQRSPEMRKVNSALAATEPTP